MCTLTSLSLYFNILYRHDFYGVPPEHIKQTAAYSVFFQLKTNVFTQKNPHIYPIQSGTFLLFIIMQVIGHQAL